MENLLSLGVPILKHITVLNFDMMVKYNVLKLYIPDFGQGTLVIYLTVLVTLM